MSCKEENAIPFDFDVKENEMPTVILSIPCNADEGFVDLRFGADTGADINTFYNNTELKVFGSQENIEKLIAKSGITVDFEKGETVNFGILNIKCANIIFPDLLIKQTSKGDKTILDGVLGYNAFKDYGIVIFDFRKKKIVLGEKKVHKNVLPLKIKNFKTAVSNSNLLMIPVEIDGKMNDVILDTGFSSLGEPMILTSPATKMPKSFSVKIGSVLYKNVKLDTTMDGFYCNLTSENAENFFKDILLMGNAFFQNHRIQLDFENMTFAMD